jgi:hypothetical protein
MNRRSETVGYKEGVRMPELYAGTDNVVLIKHCRREMSYDYWHLIFTGKPGTAAGIFTRLPGETPVKRFVARVA